MALPSVNGKQGCLGESEFSPLGFGLLSFWERGCGHYMSSTLSTQLAGRVKSEKKKKQETPSAATMLNSRYINFCLFCCLLCIAAAAGISTECDYTSLAKDPCDETANRGSCADYYQLYATTEYQIITSPKYPGFYPDNIVCRWVLSACNCGDPSNPDPNVDYRVEFETIDYDMQDSPSCTKDFLEIKNGKRLWGHRSFQKCGNTCASGDKNSTQSTGKHLLVSFQTDVFDPKDPTPHRGFYARFHCVAVPILQNKSLELGPANYLLIALSVLLALMFGGAAVGLFIRERRRHKDGLQLGY